MAERALVVEDDPATLEACAEVLRQAAYEVVSATTGEAAQAILRREAIDLAVVDLRMPSMGGLDVLRVAKDVDPEIAVVLITAYPTVETAVEAMKVGAADYLAKPFSAEQLLAAARAAVEKRSARETHGLLKGQLRRSAQFSGIVGRSSKIRAVVEDVGKAAAVDASVLVLGESGSGKELVARAVHDHSGRRKGPFVAINCAAIPENLLEAELFGYERGAFTGALVSRPGLLESAEGGTVFLDEISEMSTQLQAKLLRALEERAARRLSGRKLVPFDVRFIAASHRDLHEEVARERFRTDLFFRLDVIEISVPPLRDRRDDIPLLTAYFLEACRLRGDKEVGGISPDALELLSRYDWPGNVRELKNAVERGVAYATGPVVAPADLPPAVVKGVERQPPSSYREWKEKALERLERDYLESALAEHDGNVTRAAQALGIHRSTLQRLMRRLGLPAV
jgi:DNA-binding NtrC family response regulator